MKMKINLELLFCTALIASVYSLSIRDFSSKEYNDVEPDYKDYAGVARYVVHKSEWASMGTISTLKSMNGFPMVNIISVADSARGEKSTGNIYFFLTNLDFTGQDLLKNNKLTVLFSNDQDLECSKKNVDPMEPTCARIILSGSIITLTTESEEYGFAYRAFLSRHPAAATWIKTHAFYLCKLDIVQIVVLDWYGGPHFVTPEDYYNANNTSSGFLDYESSSKAIQLVNYNSDVSKRQSLDNKNENNRKIKIEIKKGKDAVTIEL